MPARRTAPSQLSSPSPTSPRQRSTSTTRRSSSGSVENPQESGFRNFGRPVLFQRYEYGGLPAASTLTTVGTGSFGGAPDYTAVNPNTDASLQITNLPSGIMINGGMLYVTEIYTRHTLLTPFDRFGVTVPNTLYSIAYF